jgi:hypothetical protein
MAGAGAGWWETSDALGEGASAAPVPAAEGGACDIGDEMAEELSVHEVSLLILSLSLTIRLRRLGAIVEGSFMSVCSVGDT